MILYHGSTYDFNKIDVNMGRGFKDFGKGFYLAFDKNHAVKLALRNKRFLDEKLGGTNNSAYLYEYEFDIERFGEYNAKIFRNADLEWIRFVLANRDIETKSHNYDIVRGPTANDLTNISIQAYYNGIYGETGSEKALTTLIQMLETENLSEQIYFGNQNATQKLVFVRRTVL